MLEFDVLWEHLGLGVPPVVLDVASHGATLDERAALAEQVWESLAERGLGWPGQVDDRLRASLRMLVHSEWELDARLQLTTSGPPTRALIVANRADATVAIRHATRVRLQAAPADRIVREALALLPAHPPGTGRSITLPAQALDAAAARAGASPDALANALASQGLGHAEARTIADVAGNVIRFGHFGAARTRRGEQRRRAGHVVSVYDTHQRRYLFTRKPSSGTPWVTLLPGTEAALTRQLNELLAELGRPVDAPVKW
ncbi:ESX secretion-associated protein EspG [Actinophytocola sp.]|uniref:ESX secretion-associated protein EspG n=1 Tax=Actinophytocola sp. TaxID=1872138 RepID=UPI002D7EF3B9|nr:ESX secretion-associated protein EspG [Actinophytocola sp.]HET9143228.1 ESX secretion-associated protein EspG [Actinophytocola sp.]